MEQAAKPGWKSTEAWITLVLTALGGLLALGIVGEGTQVEKYIGGALALGSQFGYTGGRAWVKGKMGGTKPGWKSTEAWLTLGTTLLGGSLALGIVGEGTQAEQYIGGALALGSQFGYTGGRSWIKGKLATPASNEVVVDAAPDPVPAS